jgi:hypothetical protein
MVDEICVLLLNIKLELKDYPVFYNIEINNIKPVFAYDDRWEFVVLSRSAIKNRINEFINLKNERDIIVWYLVDDSLCDYDITMNYIMDLKSKINKTLYDKIYELRLKYDEISRKYVGQNLG